MSAESTLYKVLATVEKTYPNPAPLDAPRRRLTYFRVEDVDTPTYDGDGSGATKVRIQVDAWAESKGDARRLSDAARAALYAGMTIGAVFGNPDDYEPDTKLYRASFDVEVWE